MIGTTVQEIVFLLFILNLLWLLAVLPPFKDTARDSYRYFLQKTARRHFPRVK